ncbi:MAG: hypothetical protein ACRELT_02465, partial [Longimicrobiales bacterium]
GQITFQRPHWHSNQADWAYKQPGFWVVDPPETYPGGSRWFAGANESTPHPTAGVATAGTLPGVTIFKPTPYMSTGTPAPGAMSGYVDVNGTTRGETLFRRFYGSMFGVQRAADVRFFWGAAGLDSVVDVTHDVRVRYHPHAQATHGFLTDGDGNGVLNYGDFYYIPQTGVACNANEVSNLPCTNPAPLAAQPVVLPTDVTGDLAGDGNGFGIYVNGEPYLFTGAVPTNTVWTLRSYNGTVTQNAAGTYAFASLGRTPAVPGLGFVLQVNAPAQIVAAEADLTRVHTVPDQ